MSVGCNQACGNWMMQCCWRLCFAYYHLISLRTQLFISNNEIELTSKISGLGERIWMEIHSMELNILVFYRWRIYVGKYSPKTIARVTETTDHCTNVKFSLTLNITRFWINTIACDSAWYIASWDGTLHFDISSKTEPAMQFNIDSTVK